MSQAPAAFFFDDGDVLYGVYCATLNVMRPVLSPDPDAPLIWADMTREHVMARKSTTLYDELDDEVAACAHEREHVVAATAHRGGTAWHGAACRACLLFLGPYAPLEVDAEELLDVKSVGGVEALWQAASARLTW
ncbi:MAG TPA: hypothetical protein VNJ51_14375 [Candidatus Dormibacteraeota bacterium]|nr:hypothetical protein [Candidatus Dormibacteraeota bacterium]